MLPSEELGLRACDVMENTLCGSDTYAMARMDEMIVSVEAVCVSQGDPVFFRLISLKPRNVSILQLCPGSQSVLLSSAISSFMGQTVSAGRTIRNM